MKHNQVEYMAKDTELESDIVVFILLMLQRWPLRQRVAEWRA